MTLSRTVALVYGVIAYAVFFASFLYAIPFVGGFLVPKTVDTGPAEPRAVALAIDVVLVGLFGLHHSVAARAGFKRAWTRLVPVPLERSTYVLTTSLLLDLLFWQWRPLAPVVWTVETPALRAAIWAVFSAGWGILLLSTFMVDHFDLFGLRQVWLHFRGREYTPAPFKTTGFYRFVRHPLLLGVLIAFWATPHMTLGHVVFAGGMTAYILIGVRFEERDLARFLGEDYRRWRERVPMLIPSLRPFRGEKE
jgi:protein-S-isoprenylcysteine O-methyltransferase Ste14